MTQKLRGEHGDSPGILIDNLSSVGQSLVWAFQRGVAWNPNLLEALTRGLPVTTDKLTRAAWGSFDDQSGNSKSNNIYEISGEELYLILSHTIYEREGVEHDKKLIDAQPASQWLTDATRLRAISFDRRGIRASGLKVTDPTPDGIVLNSAGLFQPIPIALDNCIFQGRIVLDKAKLGHLSLAAAAFTESDSSADKPDISADGARIDGDLILTNVKCRGVSLSRISVDKLLTLENSTIDYFQVADEKEEQKKISIIADAAKIGGSVFMRNGFVAKGAALFIRANIGGNFDCSRGTFDNPNAATLVCDGVTVGNAIFLRRGFSSNGAARFVNAKAGTQFACDGATFTCASRPALLCEAIQIGADVFLTDGFSAVGDILFTRARIGGAVTIKDCLLGGSSDDKKSPKENQGLTFRTPLEAKRGDFKISFRSASVGSTFSIRNVNYERKAAGIFDLSDAHANALADDLSYWSNPGVTIALDGFVYRRFAENAPTKWKTRRDWLLRQPDEHIGRGFRPQPWIECATALRNMGHDGNALRIDESREWVRITSYAPKWMKIQYVKEVSPFALIFDILTILSRGLGWLTDFIFGTSTGFGRAHWRAFLTGAIVVMIGARIYGDAFENGRLIRDPESNFRTYDDLNSTIPVVNKSAKTPYPAFDAFLYSLDVFLPIVDLRQSKYWLPGDFEELTLAPDALIEHSSSKNSSPNKKVAELRPEHIWLWRWTWFEILMGWVLTTVIVAGFTGILDRK